MSVLFGFIGVGNMGGALAKAAAKSTKDIWVTDYCVEKAERIRDLSDVEISYNAEIAQNAKYIVLGVKPQMMAEVLGGIKDVLQKRDKDSFVLVSMAAGLSIDTIRSYAGGDYKVIRIMPNILVEVGEGEILYAKSGNTTYEELGRFLDNMQYAGELMPINEDLMNAGCSLSGCGPAFVYMFIRALAQGGIDCGLNEETAIKLAAQTVKGAAKMLRESPLSPDVLIKNVCSPGGSTIEGVKSLEADQMEESVRKALAAAYKRNIELGKSNG
ncbi:MAG: pyrroline-5-carboxylate reductase [Ruminococcus sp.]|nr:pyrroline-5-carboxylate reductase [Ruminococcus sp.]